jgi:hypothetical protein
MPGQAPQGGGAPPQQMAINPNINYNRAVELFKDLPDDAVQRALADPQMAAIAAAEVARRARIRNGAKGQEAVAAGKPPTVISQLLGAQPQAQPQQPPQMPPQQMPQPQQPPQEAPQGMDQGLAGMPAPNMQQGFAEGGVVAFEGGGDPAVEALRQASEEVLAAPEGLEALPVAQVKNPAPKPPAAPPKEYNPTDAVAEALKKAQGIVQTPQAPKLSTPEETIRKAEEYAKKEGAANDIYKPYLERTQKELKAAEGDSSDKNMKRSLMLAGLQMLASDKRGLAGIAEGGIKGMQQYELLQEKDQARKEKLRDAELKLVEAKDARRRGDMDRFATLMKQYETNVLEAQKLGVDTLRIQAALAGDITRADTAERELQQYKKPSVAAHAASNALTAQGLRDDKARQRMIDIEAKAMAYAKGVAEASGLPGPAAQAAFEKAYAAKIKELRSQVMVDSVAIPPAGAKVRN